MALATALVPVLSWGCEIDFGGHWKLDLEHFLNTHTDGSIDQRELWTSAFAIANPTTWNLDKGEGELRQNGNTFSIRYSITEDCNFTFSAPDVPGSEQSFQLIKKQELVCFTGPNSNVSGDCFARHDA